MKVMGLECGNIPIEMPKYLMVITFFGYKWSESVSCVNYHHTQDQLRQAQ